jgi:tRNA 5-methylaminomethyl-2-thiouridine biosynthesis bifunctional protein
MSEAAQGFQSGTNLKQRIPLLFHPGMFVSVGHGSRGLLSCPLGGEIIARTIACGDLGSLREIAQVVSAERFAYHTLTTPA